MPGLIGKKIGMTSVFGADGKNIPCTVIEAGPCVVTQIRTVEKYGYAAVQLAYGEKTEKHTSAPLQGHFKKAGTTPKAKLVEFHLILIRNFNSATWLRSQTFLKSMRLWIMLTLRVSLRVKAFRAL